MDEPEVVAKEEHFPLSSAQANLESRCPQCGLEVKPATPEQAEYAREHPLLCRPCLEARNEMRTKMKVRLREAKARQDGR